MMITYMSNSWAVDFSDYFNQVLNISHRSARKPELVSEADMPSDTSPQPASLPSEAREIALRLSEDAGALDLNLEKLIDLLTDGEPRR